MRSIFAAVFALIASPVLAEDAYCDMWSDLTAENPSPSLWTVKEGVGQLMFQTNSGEGYSCPGDDPKCSANAYLIDGDPVVVTSEAGDYACTTFTNDGKENVSTGGWLPKASLEPATLPAGTPADFVGKWRYGDEQSIDITAARDGTLTIAGDATWGMHDPQRVENGGVNVGQISAELKPDGNFAAWTNAGPDGEAGPWQPGDADHNCSVRMWALPPFLVVSDNGMCGGNNVTFTGVYALAD